MADGDESLRCRGMRDLLPDEMARFRRVESAFGRVCRQWGYSEIRTPTIEFLHLFTTAGTLSPQMLDRTYSFLDWDGWSGERVVLRPDATIPAARLYVENLAPGQIARFFYTQNVFRFSSGDESREDWQCGVELIGDLGLAGDLELILLGRAALAELGLERLQVGLSHAGLVRTVLAAASLAAQEQVACYDRLLDGDLSVLEEVEARLPELKAPLHLLFDVRGGKAAYLANLQASFLPALPALEKPVDDLAKISDVLERAGCDYDIETTLVRNFEYYTGPVFEFRVEGKRVGGGGRYDELMALVGGERVPASGFALDVDKVASRLGRTVEEGEQDVWLVMPADDSAEVLAAAFASVDRLQRERRTASIAVSSAGPEPARWELAISQAEGGLAYELRDRKTGAVTRHGDLEGLLRSQGE